MPKIICIHIVGFFILLNSRNSRPEVFCKKDKGDVPFLYINSKKFKQSPQKSLICETISKTIGRGEQEAKINYSTARTG